MIEPYVRAIGFVDNPAGNYSRLQTLTIEEFREHQAGHLHDGLDDGFGHPPPGAQTLG